MRPIRALTSLALLSLLLAGCGPDGADTAAEATSAAADANAQANGNGEFISASTPVEAAKPYDVRQGTDWPTVVLETGEASVSCELDYAGQGDGEPLAGLSHAEVTTALEPCRGRGLLRLRYEGKINGAFTALVERMAVVADRLGLDKRVLDIDSSGGQVEDAIRAGDLIGAAGWTIWVREGAVCHSACVLILGAGDMRMVSGNVGIHRIIRMSSTATSRAELNTELQAVYGRVREYLQRNGVAVAVADMMMAVPNRNLRLLTSAELQQYGLDGSNPAQDDLDRLQLMRKCGEDFVRRRDSFGRAFDRECRVAGTELEELNACGLALRPRFGFPDAVCALDSPMSEFDTPEAIAARATTTDDGPHVAGGDAAAGVDADVATAAGRPDPRADDGG